MQRNVATEWELLSCRGCNRTNFEKQSTASKRCLVVGAEWELLWGSSTSKSNAHVCLGPGGRGVIDDHVGADRY